MPGGSDFTLKMQGANFKGDGRLERLLVDGCNFSRLMLGKVTFARGRDGRGTDAGRLVGGQGANIHNNAFGNFAYI